MLLHHCADGGQYSAGIGSGHNGTCGNITIGAGITYIRAQKGVEANDCIGRDLGGTCGTVTIDPSLTHDTLENYILIYPTAP